MFYFDEDKREIRGWLKSADEKLREEIRIEFQTAIRSQQNNFISAQQLAQYDVEFQSRVDIVIGEKARETSAEVAAVRKIFNDFKANEFDRLKNSSAATSEEIADIKAKIAALQLSGSASSSDEVAAVRKIFNDFKANEFDRLKNSSAATSEKIAALSAENDALKKQVAQHAQNFDALKNTVATALNDIQKNFFGLLQQRDAQFAALTKRIDKLESSQPPVDVDSLKAEIVSLNDKLAALTERIKKLEPPDDDEKFFLPEQSKEFFPADSKEISAKVKEALNIRELESFLSANSSINAKQFQKLLATHLKDVKKFVDKLKLDELEDMELSEGVTSKFFNLFHRTIFDNILIATRRGLKSSDKNIKAFYSDFLYRLNGYLTRCGIYSLNVKGNRAAESDDYENMTPQILKTTDKNLSGKIESIERLPYRINYLDEFGEQKFFQHAGIMNIYKAV